MEKIFFFQIKVHVVKMRDDKVREVCHQPKVRKSPYLLIQVKDHFVVIFSFQPPVHVTNRLPFLHSN